MESLARFRLLAEFTNEIIFFSDRVTLHILEANEAAARAYGHTRAEMTSLRVPDLRAPQSPIDPKDLVRTDRQQGVQFETYHQRKDGTIFPVDVVARTTHFRGRDIIISTVRDITERRRAASHTERLTRLLGIVTNSRLNDDARLQAILLEGSRSIRQGQLFLGQVSRVEGDRNVVETNVRDPDDKMGDELERLRPVGQSLPLEETIAADMLAAGCAMGWNDVSAIPPERLRKHSRNAPWHSVIGAPLHVAGTTYFLVFSSLEPVRGGFTQADYDYIETLASFLASRLHQMRLADQLRRHIEFDALTSLPKLAQLRAAFVRCATNGANPTLVLADIDAFRCINEKLGHMWGDAALVELGAASLKHRAGDECVARISGNTFGLLMDPKLTHDEIEVRIASWRELFARPLSLGDRDRKQFVQLHATFAVAPPSPERHTFEEVLAQAEAALHVCKEEPRVQPRFIGFE